MLNFDDGRFLRIQSDAVALAEPIDAFVGDSLDRGLENIHFLGAGGAGVLMQPAAQQISRNSDLTVFLEKAAEIVQTGSRALGSRSLVVIPSLSGTTHEALDVLQLAQSKGASVLALTGDPESPVAQAADTNFSVGASDDTSSESFYLQSLLLALSVLRRRGELQDYSRTVEELAQMPSLLLRAKQAFEGRAEKLAMQLQDVDYHIFTGAGGPWTEAWYFATCILEEMQWIRTRPVHASDYFHGTLELVEKGVSVVLLKGEGPSRALADRVERFTPTVTDKLTVIDSADFDLGSLRDSTRELVSHIVHATVLQRFAAHLEQERRHPLSTRRYYRRLDY
ncbi:SIS domain-containing protein [Aeromicrobium sp. CTD01-1L150]|uniref:SIS domain-containing protein n=1 Tax=Aeromicrobium sp. CTD01-1L150 TaxID=3341830 RepID=UPI0035BFF39B